VHVDDKPIVYTKADTHNRYEDYTDTDGAGALSGASTLPPYILNNGTVLELPLNFKYDARGNLIEDEHFQYVWDDFDRIIKVTDKTYCPGSPTPATVQYRYDAAGRRVAAIYEGESSADWPDVRYLYDGLSLIEERRLDDDALLRRYYYEGPINKLALVEVFNGAATLENAYVPLTDDRGTIMGVIDVTDPQNITLIEKLYYNSTGLCKSYDGSDTENLIPDTSFNIARSQYLPFGWCGMYRDPFTGKYHTHFRDYDPLHNRWLSPDPAGYQDGLNLYAAYMGVNEIDLYGLGIWEWFKGLFFEEEEKLGKDVVLPEGVPCLFGEPEKN